MTGRLWARLRHCSTKWSRGEHKPGTESSFSFSLIFLFPREREREPLTLEVMGIMEFEGFVGGIYGGAFSSDVFGSRDKMATCVLVVIELQWLKSASMISLFCI